MKKVVILGLIVGLIGCQQPSSSNNIPAEPTGASVVSQAPSPVKFEVRDFKLDEQRQSYGSTIQGRATLVAKDDTMKKGNYMVWLSVRQAHKNDERWKTLIVLRDGIGTIETYDFLPKEDNEKKKVKYFDWEVLGFVKLQEGIISSDEPPPVTK